MHLPSLSPCARHDPASVRDMAGGRMSARLLRWRKRNGRVPPTAGPVAGSRWGEPKRLPRASAWRSTG